MKTDKKVDTRLDRIARYVFEEDGLEEKNWDRKDFAEVSKAGLRAMLEDAYAFGLKDSRLI